MVNIPNAGKLVPLMFQAQVKGRSQLQYIDKDAEIQDSQRWASEWTQEAYPHPPELGKSVAARTYKMQWRFVTNGGQFEGIIFPALGAFGLPFYPGSSMKGLFCQVCTEEQKQRYRLTKNGDEPSLLRFHGGYPVNDWKQKLVDIVHPQQKWQVQTANTREKPGNETGFALISLWEPVIKFGISSQLPDTDWEEIWAIWERALGYGIGCRTSSGYGLPKERLNESGEVDCPISLQGEQLYRAFLKGEGQAPKLIGGENEFRPNVFRGSLRGHALRVFGGLTDKKTAERLVENLFGGVENGGTQSLLTCAFQASALELGKFTRGHNEPTYKVAGELRWLLMPPRELDEIKREKLQKLLQAFMRFALLFGGFGKSWRRADHRRFYEDYYESNRAKPLIGCHWQWDRSSLPNAAKVSSLNRVAPFIDEVRQVASEWMQLQGIEPDKKNFADWREAWHPNYVQVWGRLAEGAEDCVAVRWLHEPYQRANRQFREAEQSIKQSSVTGRISQVGRLWHRMYPVVKMVDDPKNPGKKKPRVMPNYLELLTIFPDDSDKCDDFLDFLDKQPEGFRQLW
jgi:CRISPR-associated protein Cmr6